jgi:ABC-2 type transport system ATP-binding protein
VTAIDVRDLHKAFGSVQAVAGITFAVREGEVFSLLGPNGAGKSTTISILSSLIEPTSGDAAIMGHSLKTDSQAARAQLGVVPQEIALYPDLTARENLAFWGKMYGLRGAALNRRIEAVLETIGLNGRQRDRVSTFSGGMKRRVNIGAALLHGPSVVIMDEPTVGIDPQSRRHILDHVKALNAAGTTVLYTTHYMEEAAELSHRIAIMDQGRIIACGTHDELINQVGGQTRIDLTVNIEPERVLPAWRAIDGVAHIDSANGRITALVDDSNVALPRLFEAATPVGARITSVDINEPNLESVFLKLTGKALRDA